MVSDLRTAPLRSDPGQSDCIISFFQKPSFWKSTGFINTAQNSWKMKLCSLILPKIFRERRRRARTNIAIYKGEINNCIVECDFFPGAPKVRRPIFYTYIAVSKGEIDNFTV